MVKIESRAGAFGKAKPIVKIPRMVKIESRAGAFGKANLEAFKKCELLCRLHDLLLIVLLIRLGRNSLVSLNFIIF
jgi:hypothetical protein